MSVEIECPCKREGKGCTNYAAYHHGTPKYVCRFTGQEAFVPRDDEGTATGGMYG